MTKAPGDDDGHPTRTLASDSGEHEIEPSVKIKMGGSKNDPVTNTDCAHDVSNDDDDNIAALIDESQDPTPASNDGQYHISDAANNNGPAPAPPAGKNENNTLSQLSNNMINYLDQEDQDQAVASSLRDSLTAAPPSLGLRHRGRNSRTNDAISSASYNSAKIANEAKNDQMNQRFARQQQSSQTNQQQGGGGRGRVGGGLPSPSSTKNNKQTPSSRRRGETAYSVSLDEDVATVDKLLIRIAYGVILTWISLVAFSYWIVPPDCIQWYEGTERNAALVELSILSTAVIMKHFPLLWEMNFMDTLTEGGGGGRGGTGGSRDGMDGDTSNGVSPRRKAILTASMGGTQFSGILAGGLVTQCIAVLTATIMVCFPVPVMIDPVLGSRVHFMRWCEWIPLAGYMTLMTECIDAPEYDGEKLTHPWKVKFTVSALESISTLCGLVFPFCTNFFVWMAAMVFSCVTYSAIIVRYFEKRRLFVSCVWRGGGSVDEIELFERARMSLALHGVCSVVWTLITLNYFVTSAGHLIVPKTWVFMHDPAATMIGECFMDLLAKCLYMALIIEAHHTAFDEAKRANRRLAELRNTMSVVWENSSDTIAISVQKMSGNVTSMVSPSFFRPALIARQQQHGKMEDLSAIILEHSNAVLKSKRGSITNVSKVEGDALPEVAFKLLQKADFASVDLHSAGNSGSFEYIGQNNDAMTSLVVAFTDMLARAWQNRAEEFVFEHDTVLENGSVRTKFEVKVTRLEANTVMTVVRNVSERFRRFEAEKRFVFETTARQKDAEANRFTRHEVKNGLLAAIEICGTVREQLSDDFSLVRHDLGYKIDTNVSEENVSGRIETMAELDTTLHEVLDIVLAETVSCFVMKCLTLY